MISTSTSLLARLRTGEETGAWKRFVSLYTPVLFYWVRRQGVPSDDTADLVQEVFAVLVKKLPTFQYDKGQRFGSWLRTIAVNKCRDYYRRRRSRPGSTRDPVDQEVPDHIESFSEAEYRQRLARRALEIMEEEFQPSTWKACWETAVVGRAASDVAQELGLSVNAVYLAKSRVLRRLREELDGLLD
jgi:RNA polymerase sigma-70 factor (ECF subfamily)